MSVGDVNAMFGLMKGFILNHAGIVKHNAQFIESCLLDEDDFA